MDIYIIKSISSVLNKTTYFLNIPIADKWELVKISKKEAKTLTGKGVKEETYNLSVFKKPNL